MIGSSAGAPPRACPGPPDHRIGCPNAAAAAAVPVEVCAARAAQVIVPDGRTDEEKVRQLLGSPEQTHLDFKGTLDLSITKDRVEFVKDAVTMGNRPPGGYIVIGVDDSGRLCIPADELVKPRQFDAANLNQKVRAFIEHQTMIISQIHKIDDHDVVVV